MPRNPKSFFCWSVRAVGAIGLLFLIVSQLKDPIFPPKHTPEQQLKRIADAMFHYAREHHGDFPSRQCGRSPNRDGIFPHSWRVYLLPYLNEEKLFRQIRLDEPWDSAWNRQFHAQMPNVYRNWESLALQKCGADMTTYCVVSGVGTMFPEDGTCRNIQEFRGQAHRKILLLESSPDCWMNPNHDVKIENALRSPSENDILRTPDGTFWATMFNGDVYALQPRHFPPSVLWRFLLVPVE